MWNFEKEKSVTWAYVPFVLVLRRIMGKPLELPRPKLDMDSKNDGN